MYRRDFIKQGLITAAALSAFSPVVSAGPESETQDTVAEPLRCSFCSKSQNEVSKLIAGPGVFICDECVDVCQEIIADSEETVVGKPGHPWPSDSNYVCNLCSMLSPADQNTIIRDRGVIVCKACVDAILATVLLKKSDG